jgi:hypothetical protein
MLAQVMQACFMHTKHIIVLAGIHTWRYRSLNAPLLQKTASASYGLCCSSL